MSTTRLMSTAAIAGLILTLGLAAPAVAADTYEIDASHSTVLFRVKHLNVSYFHGRFNKLSGKIVWDEDPQKIEIAVKIDASSVDTNNEKRDQHLRNPDFFNSKQFPVITFQSTGVKKLEGDHYEVTGDLTFHGVKKSITTKFEFTGAGKDPWGGVRAGGEAVFTISRSDFGIDYMPDGLGDDVRITVAIEGVKK